MKLQTRSHSALCSLGLVLALAASLAAPADGSSDYYYTYFDQPRALGLDTTHIAVQLAATDSIDPLDATLAAHGIDADDLAPLTIGGWFRAPTAEGDRNAAGIETLVDALAGSDGLAFVSPIFIDSRGEPLIITPHLLIGFHEAVSPEAAERILSSHVAGAIVERDFAGLAGVYRLHSALRSGFEVLDLANRLAQLPEISFAESDMIIRARLMLIPNDPMFGQQWALNQGNDQDMDAPEAWDITTGDGSIVVVILDAGIQQNHPDINQVPGEDFTGHNTPGGGPYNECDNHATSVAGCVSATINNSIGIVGVAPDCKVTSAKIGTTMMLLGFCLPFIDSQPSMLINALDWSVTSGARVTNSSFGYEESSALTTAYNDARTNGVIHFAATGNDSSSTISYPASLASVNAVGALNSSGTKASFGTYGVGIAFSAPGEGILTTDRTGGDGYASGDYATVDGTSFSSPYAAGVAALVLARNPSLAPTEVEQIMMDTCVDLGAAGYDTTYGWGFVNAHNAVLAAAPSYAPGDMNCDGEVDFGDINPFVQALSDPAGYEAAYPDCDIMNADINDDDVVDFGDINPFVTLLSG